MKKKKVLILTLNDYIIYQPTILNLYDFLLLHFEVQIVSFEPQFATKKKDEVRNIVYLRPNSLLKQFFHKFDFLMSKMTRLIRRVRPQFLYHYVYYNNYLPHVLKKYLKSTAPRIDIIIAVDFPALYVAQQHFGSVHFLSLEVDNKSNPYYNKIDRTKINSVVIQLPMRYDYLFPNLSLRTFYIQNAPVFHERPQDTKMRKDFVWAGAMHRWLAVMECIEFFNQFEQYRLVLKGGGDKKSIRLIHQRFGHLINANRIHIDDTYLPGDSFIDFLSTFRIGFVFYSWELIRNQFNFLSAPSGKLFMCLAAGTPVIACNIPGFAFIKEFNAGVLIDDYDPATIHAAILEIEADYAGFSKRSYAAARHHSFDKAVEPYIHFLLQEVSKNQ